MARAPILAAGGIVVRGGRVPLVAIVQLRRRNDWMLPKGKLNRGETARDAARREVLKETGHDVLIQEFLGTMSYEVGGTQKVVQFWRMEAINAPARDLMRDVRAVQWLPLRAAIKKLSHPREQAFLAHAGPAALKAARRSARSKLIERIRTWLQRKKRKRGRSRR